MLDGDETEMFSRMSRHDSRGRGRGRSPYVHEPKSKRAVKASELTFAGILNAIDGVAAQTGCMLFMTTNHREMLDPALIRPGRVDVQLVFDKATQDQARRLYLQFYACPTDRDFMVNSGEMSLSNVDDKSNVEGNKIAKEELEQLAVLFGESIPDKSYTMSQIQGILMNYRTSPELAVQNISNDLIRAEGDDTLMALKIPKLSQQISGSFVR